MIVLYRQSTNKIIWKGTGHFYRQHDVDILDSERISIFNNNSLEGTEGYFGGGSVVVIYDFKKDKYSKYLSEALIKNKVKTLMEGRSEILPNGDLFIEESNRGRTLFFNADGTLRWEHYNRAADDKVYRVGWSRILHSAQDIKIVKNFLNSREKCND